MSYGVPVGPTLVVLGTDGGVLVDPREVAALTEWSEGQTRVYMRSGGDLLVNLSLQGVIDGLGAEVYKIQEAA